MTRSYVFFVNLNATSFWTPDGKLDWLRHERIIPSSGRRASISGLLPWSPRRSKAGSNRLPFADSAGQSCKDPDAAWCAAYSGNIMEAQPSGWAGVQRKFRVFTVGIVLTLYLALSAVCVAATRNARLGKDSTSTPSGNTSKETVRRRKRPRSTTPAGDLGLPHSFSIPYFLSPRISTPATAGIANACALPIHRRQTRVPRIRRRLPGG